MKRILICLFAAAFVLSSCGGETDPADQVTEVADKISQAEPEDEIREVCEELLTPAFLEEVYRGSVAKCEAKPPNDEEEDENAGQAEVESVEVDGSKASARMAVVGGKAKGIEGTWTFAEADGKWRLDRLEDDFLRASLTKSTAVVDGGALSYEPLRKCMGKQFEALPSAELRKLMFQIMRGDEEKGMKSVLEVSDSCPGQLAGYVANELATKVIGEQGGTPAQVRCARKNLKPLLQLTGLSSMAISASIDSGSSSAVPAALAGLIGGAMKDCPA